MLACQARWPAWNAGLQDELACQAIWSANQAVLPGALACLE
jgi:hypothetical protein